ncbi:MAG: ABC transporter permease [Planctomycetaceae bacterium]|nr:ABC transporter permease [Planctomycetaceae bacterium]
MTASRLIFRSLWHYRWTSGAVLLATAVASAVLVGALTVGDSVNGTLRDRALVRLGGVQSAVVSPQRMFTAALADRMSASGVDAAAWLQARGSATAREGKGRANDVHVLGVDEESWRQCGGRTGQYAQGAIINTALARQLGVAAGERIVLRVARRNAMDADAPLAQTGSSVAALALDVAAVAPETPWGNFSLQANPIAPQNVFVSRELLARRLEQPDRANLILSSAPRDKVQRALEAAYTLEDAGLKIVAVPGGKERELRSEAVFLSPPEVRAAIDDAPAATVVLTYFVNELRVGDKTTPYSMVAGIGPLPPAGQGTTEVSRDSRFFLPFYTDLHDDQIVINQWLADDLAAKPGDTLTLAYYVMDDTGRLSETRRSFTIAAIAPIEGLAADATLMPDFPGLADAENCRDWKAGPYINLGKIRPKDEQYWKQYRGTPKAFVTLAAAQSMWANRYGNLTAVRFSSTGVPPVHATQNGEHGRDARATRQDHEQDARATTLPQALGIFAQDVREQALSAAKGANDFASLFIGLSFFVIASALLLTALVFSLGITQRSEQIGILKATGFAAGAIRRLLMGEGMLLALAGGALGVILGIGYAWLTLRGLSTIWSGAVAGAQINLHVMPLSLLTGAAMATAAAVVAMYVTLRRLSARTAQQLLSRQRPVRNKHRFWWHWLTSDLRITGPFSMRRLAVRYLLGRCGRNLATIALLACAVFLIVMVSVFRQDSQPFDIRSSGTGGFALIGESAAPISAAKAALPADDVQQHLLVVALRLHEGDDATCLNLNAAQRPRILGVNPAALRNAQRFSFASPQERSSSQPWALLDAENAADEIPAVADQNTITYALHSAIGQTIAITDDWGKPLKIRLVGSLRNSILQGSLVISEKHFVRHFASEGGYRSFLIETPAADRAAIASALSETYQDYGLELRPTDELLAQLNSVQNTYLAIFQALGGLGLVLGSAGLGLVLMRNVIERRSELAIMRAVGFTRRRIVTMVLAEHLALLALGLVIGLAAAAVVVVPQARFMGAHVPAVMLAAVLGAVVLVGAASAFVAARLALRGQLIDALREE